MYEQLKKRLDNVKENEPMAAYTTFKIGGPARYFFVARSANDMAVALGAAVECEMPYFILAGGSNLLVSDKGFDGLVIKDETRHYTIDGTRVSAEAGAILDELTRATVDHGLTGMDSLVDIPGTVGGAVRGNAGAYGTEIKDVVRSVNAAWVPAFGHASAQLFTKIHHQSRRAPARADNPPFLNENNSTSALREGPPVDTRTAFTPLVEVMELKNEECKFSYRHSIFKERSDLIVLEVKMELKEGDKEKMIARMEEVVQLRRAKYPSDPSSGCMFKNMKFAQVIRPGARSNDRAKFVLKGGGQEIPDELARKMPEQFFKWNTLPTAWVIGELGLEGTRVGSALISPRHKNFVVNGGDAKASDVLALIALVKKRAKERFGLELQEEVELVGF